MKSPSRKPAHKYIILALLYIMCSQRDNKDNPDYKGQFIGAINKFAIEMELPNISARALYGPALELVDLEYTKLHYEETLLESQLYKRPPRKYYKLTKEGEKKAEEVLLQYKGYFYSESPTILYTPSPIPVT